MNSDGRGGGKRGAAAVADPQEAQKRASGDKVAMHVKVLLKTTGPQPENLH